MLRALLGFCLAGLAVAGPAAAEDFYKGKVVKVVVSSAAGGGYDAYARLIARHMPKYVPGEPTMVVVNMPGAEGIVAGNHLFNAAEKDGTVFGTFNRFIVLMQILGNEQAKFKPDGFQWIGTTASYSDNSYLLVIRAALPHKTAEDLRNPAMPPIHLGNTGTDVPQVLQEALGLNFKIVSGYKGSDDMELAFNRGEVDAHTSGWASILSRHEEEWIKRGYIRPMIQFGRVDRLPELKDVPTARELAKTPEDRALIEFGEMPLLMARPFAAPPGVPADRVALLRAAFMKAVRDPAYIAEGTKQKLELTPKSGEEVQRLVSSLATASPAVVARYKKALGGKGPSGG